MKYFPIQYMVIPHHHKEVRYNTTNFTTNGYFVFRPDIVYEINDPGMSAVNNVVPAVEEVLKTGMIDKDKIGHHGS